MRIVKKILKWLGIVIGVLLLIFIALLIFPEKEIVEPIQARESTNYWEMNEGFRIAYTHLEGIDSLNKTPIIFLHGGPGYYVHSSIIETFESLAGDRFGCGGSMCCRGIRHLHKCGDSGLGGQLPRGSGRMDLKGIETL